MAYGNKGKNGKNSSFKPRGGKSRQQKGGFESALGDLFKPAKRQTPKTHHDTLKGNRGNGGGKRR